MGLFRREPGPSTLQRALDRDREQVGIVRLAGEEQCLDAVDREGDVNLVWRHERRRALEQVHRSRQILTDQRPAACRCEPGPRHCAECVVARRAELDAVTTSLLEVVAEDFVQLDEIGAVLFEPRGEAFVQFRSHRFRQGVVGGVTDQQMAEAERVITCELGPVRADEFLANEGHQTRRYLRLLGCERLDCSSVKHLAFDGAALEHGAF